MRPKRKAKRREAGGELAAEEGETGEADVGKLVDSLTAKLHFSLPSSEHGELDPALAKQAKAEAPELLSVLKQLRQKVGGLQGTAHSLAQRLTAPDAKGPAAWGSGNESTATYVEVKVQMLLSYIIGLVYYMLLKSHGLPVHDHGVVPRLLWIRTVLEKLQPIDQRLQYQISKLLQWADARKAGTAPEVGSAQDSLALKPGELTAGVEDEADEEEGWDANADWKASREGGAYRPPKIAQAEFTGDHLGFREKAERDLERKRDRLDRSEFVRSLREEFTDAPAEIHAEIRSARAERAARKMSEQQAYEEDHMVRLRGSKKQAREERQLLRTRKTAPAGAVSLDDATVDFNQLRIGLGANEQRPGRGGKGRRAGSALQEFQDASERAQHSRRVVDSVLGGDLGDFGPLKRKGGGKGQGGGGKKRRK